uniref:Uncharacterized protein n=1 Tax=Graphocephala atropunctata TaxID=36148 RepID=A0A1B6LP67_9HEMI
MKHSIVLLLALLKPVVEGVEPSVVEEVCKNIRACDDAVCRELGQPAPVNQTAVFRRMSSYIEAVHKLVKCLHRDKAVTLEVAVARDLIDKKGPEFILDVPWSYRIARQNYGWDGRVIQEFINWRILTQEVWMDVEKYFDPTAHIPREMYTESYEKIV